MKILFLTWKSFGNDDMIAAFRSLGHEVEELPFADGDEPGDKEAVARFAAEVKTYQLLKQEGYIMTDRKNGARVRDNIARSGVMSEENKTELRRIVSEARLSGVPKTEIKKLIDEFY